MLIWIRLIGIQDFEQEKKLENHSRGSFAVLILRLVIVEWLRLVWISSSYRWTMMSLQHDGKGDAQVEKKEEQEEDEEIRIQVMIVNNRS